MPMTFVDFTASAWRTFAGQDDSPREQLLCVTLGLVGEVAEYADLYLTTREQKTVPSRARVMEEVGDALYYHALTCHVLGLDMVALLAAHGPLTEVHRPVTLLRTVGLYADAVKKACFQGQALPMGQVQQSLGKTLAHLQVAGALVGATIGEMMQMNHEKLQTRYPEGPPAVRFAQAVPHA